jgi:hypothetical protein
MSTSRRTSTMSSFSSRLVPPIPAGPQEQPAAASSILARLSDLYTFTQRSAYLFASPLGPFLHQGRSTHLPRFVFFGPHASEVSWRVAFLAGFDRRDLRSSQSLLTLLEHLSQHVEEGHGLNLTFFPIVNAAGFFLGAERRSLSSAHWGQSAAPEIDLLEIDARVSGYHGFVRVETAPPDEEVISIRVRAPVGLLAGPDVELISSEDTEPYTVRFERGPIGKAPLCGPLSVSDDLSVSAFELTLRIPATWSDERYEEAVRSILSRFILRYRAFQSYAQHL